VKVHEPDSNHQLTSICLPSFHFSNGASAFQT